MAKRLAGLDYKRDIAPPARSPMSDMNQILKMKSITTDIGRARAWIRLSIEKRLLSHHLRYESYGTKVGCAFQMAIVSILPVAGFGPNNHREDAPYFLRSNSYFDREIYCEFISVFSGN